jgi:hypothetical protein
MLEINQSEFSISCLVWRDREKEGRNYELKFTFLVRHYKWTAHLQNLRNFWTSYREWSRYNITVWQDNTAIQVPLAVTIASSYESPDFKYKAEGQLFWILLWHCLITLVNTSPKLSFWDLQFITSHRTHSDLMSTLRIK